MNAADLGTLPPHSAEAEQSTLGGLLLDCKAWPHVRDVLTEGDFYHASHRAIWRAFERVVHEDEAADLLTVGEQLRADGELDAVGGMLLEDAPPRGEELAANIGGSGPRPGLRRRHVDILLEQCSS